MKILHGLFSHDTGINYYEFLLSKLCSIGVHKFAGQGGTGSLDDVGGLIKKAEPLHGILLLYFRFNAFVPQMFHHKKRVSDGIN